MGYSNLGLRVMGLWLYTVHYASKGIIYQLSYVKLLNKTPLFKGNINTF